MRSIKNLTIKQKKFVDKYIESGNATQSYLDAGYKAEKRYVAEANARRLLANDSVRNYMNERMEELKKETIASQDEVLQYLTRVMRGQEKDQFGLDASLQDRTKCAELLGKKYVLFSERKEIDGKLDQEIRVTIEDDDDV